MEHSLTHNAFKSAFWHSFWGARRELARRSSAHMPYENDAMCGCSVVSAPQLSLTQWDT